MSKKPEYTRSVKLFEVYDFYGHHLLGLATLVYEAHALIGAGPSRLDFRISVDGNIYDDVAFHLDMSHLIPPSTTVGSEHMVKPCESKDLLSPRALDAVSNHGR